MISLFPRNDLFFDLFVEAAENMKRAAELMRDLCNGKPQREEIVGAIREVEHKGDKTTRKLLKLLAKSFITPIEREDIHSLSSSIDDVVDFIDEAASTFVMLKADEPIEEYKKQSELLLHSTRLINDAVKLIREPKNRQKCLGLASKIYDIESQGDSLHNQAIARLFSEETDPIKILRWYKLCDCLEDALDGTQRVANTIEMVVLNT
ncbi:MAG: DUF47 domain-containing protein [Candidatus Dadabacteria bacterium]|nr:MAG: DUF47 domain-containing protein [Candidatus Dadabacteria bacterium]